MATLTQLEYIVKVDQLKHFGKAAKACHVSQPSLSMQIQKVEDEIGIILFDRLKKPVMATEKGAQFIEQAKVVLREHHRLMDTAKLNEKTISGELKLGIIPTLSPYLLPLFIEDFSKTYPKVKLHIDELKTETIIESLKEDQIDAAILATPLHEKGLKEKILFYEPFYLYVSKDSELHKKSKIHESDLKGSDLWLLQDGHCFKTQVLKVCSLRGEPSVYKNVFFEGGNLETLRYLIQKNKGYTLIPELFVQTLGVKERVEHVREFYAPIPTREVSLVSRRDQWKSEILEALEKSLLTKLPKSLKPDLIEKKQHVLGI